jgi:hypothetical protein
MHFRLYSINGRVTGEEGSGRDLEERGHGISKVQV